MLREVLESYVSDFGHRAARMNETLGEEVSMSREENGERRTTQIDGTSRR